MVLLNGGSALTSTILKARFGSDVRKSSLHHGNDLTLADLVLMLQRVFRIPIDRNVVLKYKDNDGDLVTLAEDSDLLLALQNEGASGELKVEVLTESRCHDSVRNVQQQIEQIQVDVQRLLESLAGIDVAALPEITSCHKSVGNVSAATVYPITKGNVKNEDANESYRISQTYASPPSPVPSERPEVPATIQPSLQEHVSNDGYRAPPIEEDIPLETSFHGDVSGFRDDSHNSVFSPPTSFAQHNAPMPPGPGNFAPPPPSSIPSFPTSNAGPPPMPQSNNFPPPNAPFHQQQQANQSVHSSVSSTPIPQQQQPPQQQHQFGPPSVQPQAGYGSPHFPQGGPGGPPSHGMPEQAPQHFQPPPPQNQFGPPPPIAGGPPPVNSFSGPPQQQQFGQQHQQHQQQQHQQQQHQQQQQQHMGGPPQGGFAPPGPGQFSAPSQQFGGGGPPQPPSGSFAPPPAGFGPPSGGVAGVNPFARAPGPGYRQSPYHQ